MAKFMEGIVDSITVFLAWMNTALKMTTDSYCDLQTADSPTVLVAHDGSLMSLLKVHGVKMLVGNEEYNRILEGMLHSLQTMMSRRGHAIQVHFGYYKDEVTGVIADNYHPARETAKRLGLSLEDLFKERINFLSGYCADESLYLVLWTYASSLTREQSRRAKKDKMKTIKSEKLPPFVNTQNIIAAIPDLRDAHDSFVRAVSNDLNMLGLVTKIQEVHEAVHAMRRVADPEFTDKKWSPVLPGDKITIKEYRQQRGDIADVLWPALAKQILPRDAENLDLRTCRIGNRIYSSIFIDLFPKEVQPFSRLFARTVQTTIPWRMSFYIESDGLSSLKFKGVLSTILSFTSAQNRLISDSVNLLRYLNLNTDDAIVPSFLVHAWLAVDLGGYSPVVLVLLVILWK